MAKKVRLSLLSLVVVLFVGITFANPIAPEKVYVCTMFENVEIDNYRLVVQNGSGYYEPTENSCSQCGVRPSGENEGFGGYYFRFIGPTQQVFLLDKSIEVTKDNINNNAITIGSITSRFCGGGHNITKVYEIVKDGRSYTMSDRTEQYRIKQEIENNKQEMKNKIKDFPFYWSLAVIIETLVLFFISKIFRKEDQVPNKNLLLRGIIPTTITLPLLWFVLPLIILDETRYIIIGEILVAIIETIIIKYGLRISRGKAFIASFLCNMFSFIALPSSWSVDRDLKIGVTWLLIIIFFELIIIFLIGKFLRKKNEIPNKRLITAGILSPVVSALIAFLSVLLVVRIYEEVIGYYWSDWLVYITFGVMQILTGAIIIKWLRNISRKKVVITSIILGIPLIYICFILLD